MQDRQEFLRKATKIAKALNDDIYYKDFAELLGMSENGFYNWLDGAYNLGKEKYNTLYDVVIPLADLEDLCYK